MPPIPGARTVARSHPHIARELSDEAAMVAARFPETPLAIGRDKRAGIDVLAAQAEVDTVILDDAFQSWNLHRDVDIVMVDVEQPFGSGHLVPAGDLREEPGAIARADLVVVNGATSETDVLEVTRRVESMAGEDAPPVVGVKRTALVENAAGAKMPPERVSVASAIGNHAAF